MADLWRRLGTHRCRELVDNYLGGVVHVEEHVNGIAQIAKVAANLEPADDALIPSRPKSVLATFDNDLVNFVCLGERTEQKQHTFLTAAIPQSEVRHRGPTCPA